MIPENLEGESLKFWVINHLRPIRCAGCSIGIFVYRHEQFSDCSPEWWRTKFCLACCNKLSMRRRAEITYKAADGQIDPDSAFQLARYFTSPLFPENTAGNNPRSAPDDVCQDL
jgi:hypothetical protein